MKRIYRGHEIDCHRESCMGGWKVLYFTVYRLSDQREIVCSFTEGSDRVVDYMGYMRELVDRYIADPAEEFPDDSAEEIAEHKKQIKLALEKK